MASAAVEQPNYESWFKIHKATDGNAQSYYSVGLRERFQIDSFKTPASKEQIVEYADIGYDPEEAKYNVRVQARVAAGGLEQEVPPFWPKQVQGPLCWKPEEISEEDYVFHLTDEHHGEIQEALVYFKGMIYRHACLSFISKPQTDLCVKNKVSMAKKCPGKLFRCQSCLTHSMRFATTCTKAKALGSSAVSIQKPGLRKILQ
jgi:hypothetical protein